MSDTTEWIETKNKQIDHWKGQFDAEKAVTEMLTTQIQALREQLAASEAKAERMKHCFRRYAVHSNDLYHKERNKKELGEVLRLLDSIMCDPEGNCAIYGSDEDRKIGQEALSILKRLTE